MEDKEKEWKERREALREQYRRADKLACERQQSIDALQDIKRNLHKEVAKQKGDIEGLREAGKNAAKLACDRKQKIDELLGDIADLRKERETLKERIDGYLKECGEKGVEVGDLKRQLGEMRGDRQRCLEEIDKLKDEKKELVKVRDQMESRAKRAERARDKAVDKNKSLEGEINDLHEESKSQAKHSAKLTERASAAEVKARDLTQCLEKEKAVAKLVQDESKRTINKLVAERDAKDKSLREYKASYTNQGNELVRTQQELESANADKADAERLLKESRAREAVKGQEINTLEAEKGKIALDRDALKERNDKLSAQRVKNLKEIADLKKERHAQGSRIGGLVKSDNWQRRRIGQLEKQLNELTGVPKKKRSKA